MMVSTYFDVAAAICMVFLFALICTLVMLILIFIASEIIDSMRQRKKREVCEKPRYNPYLPLIRYVSVEAEQKNTPLIAAKESTSEEE